MTELENLVSELQHEDNLQKQNELEVNQIDSTADKNGVSGDNFETSSAIALFDKL